MKYPPKGNEKCGGQGMKYPPRNNEMPRHFISYFSWGDRKNCAGNCLDFMIKGGRY
jgi:hypothetical protein